MLNSVQVADRRDYVVSNILNPIPILGGPVQISVSLDTDYPWLWTGFYIGSIYSSTAIEGGFVSVKPFNLTFNILDSNRDFLFNDYVPADAINYAVTSSNIAGGNNRNEIHVINPEQAQPAGGSFVVIANNTNADGTLFFELVLTGYKVKEDCLKSVPPSRFSPVANVFGGRY